MKWKIWRQQIIREVPYENDKKKQSFERFESSGNGKNYFLFSK